VTGRTKILVVEDEPLLLLMAVDLVEDAGFEAIEARDADEAILLLEAIPDIVVSGPTSTCPDRWTD
jgi:CheY-like chemotaxis protein